jgi:hypothetical protein
MTLWATKHSPAKVDRCCEWPIAVLWPHFKVDSHAVMRVEDSRRVTQEALVIVDDSWMNIHDDLFIHLSNGR